MPVSRPLIVVTYGNSRTVWHGTIEMIEVGVTELEEKRGIGALVEAVVVGEIGA
jgi:hypothetical protein